MTEPTALDTHAHIYPAEYLDLLERGGASPETTAVARHIRADLTEEDLAQRLEWMDKAGVRTQVLAVTPQSPSLPDARASAEAARWINDAYAEVMRAHPGRFLAYAALPLPHVAESLAELERVLGREGFVGISVPTFLPGGMSLTDDALAPVWEGLDAGGVVVNIHPTGGGLGAAQVTDFGLEWVNGALIEDATAVLQLLKMDLPATYPRVRFHVAHLGGDLPFMTQRLEDNYRGWGAFARSPLESLRGMWFDAANFFEPSLRLAAEVYGHRQLLAGSDMPYFQGEQYVRAFEYVRGSGLEEGAKEAVLSGNARALYGLGDSRCSSRDSRMPVCSSTSTAPAWSSIRGSSGRTPISPASMRCSSRTTTSTTSITLPCVRPTPQPRRW